MSHPDRVGPKKPRKRVNKQRGHWGQRLWGGHKPRTAVSIAFIALSRSRWGSEQKRDKEQGERGGEDVESRMIWKGYNAGSIRMFEERTGIKYSKE